MFPLFETIAIKHGIPQNLPYHQHRYRHALRTFYADYQEASLESLLNAHPVPSELSQNALVRCRIDYHQYAQAVQYFAYTPKTISQFVPVVCDTIDYSLKYSDRTTLSTLLAQSPTGSEILIIKHGLITDCTIGNLIFKRQGEWFTPTAPLLHGTQRQFLLDNERLSLRNIRPCELDLFEEIRLINALNGLDDD